MLLRRSFRFALSSVYLFFVNGLVVSKSVNISSMPSLPLDKLAKYANSYASANGLQIEKRNEDGSSIYECAPISLLPNAFPKTAFTRAQQLAAPFNELVDRISRDHEFLQETLGGGVSDADPYTGKLLHLYNRLYIEGEELGKFARSADRLGILRSDYMLNCKEGEGGDYQLKQVELNTIASSFAGLSVSVAALHRHLTSRYQDDVKEFLEFNRNVVIGNTVIDSSNDDDGVPENPALQCLPEAMNVAHEQYKKRFTSENDTVERKPVVLFVVQDGETNTVDQRMLEFRLWEAHGVPVVRMSLTTAHSQLELDESSGALYIKSNLSEDAPIQEVSLVYFRAGYAPTDYPDGYDGIEWEAREKLERSRATKCPCLGFHLAGTKKVQQQLARPGTLERFFPKSDESAVVESMRGAFAGLYSLGDDAISEDMDAVSSALSGMEGQYVLKPQREGGGYNFYGEDLTKKLRENILEPESSDEGLQFSKDLAEFILMERLFPPQQKAVLLRSGQVEGTGDSISELGCFGTVVTSHDGSVLHNKYSGFILRTKFSNVDEGGVASGYATLSSPYLC